MAGARQEPNRPSFSRHAKLSGKQIRPLRTLVLAYHTDQFDLLLRLIFGALPQNLWVKGSNISRMEAFGFFAFPR